MNPREEQVLETLKQIIDPDLGRNIVELGFIKDLRIEEDGLVRFTLELTTPACPVRERFVAECRRLLLQLDWVREVDVTLSARKRNRSAKQEQLRGLVNVRRILGVSSCKGGVGKSTVAVNLAFALQQSGARVGIFDADVYGPSLPTMVKVDDTRVMQKPNGLLTPVEGPGGIKMMSFGYVQQGDADGPVIMRGPMVSQVIQQLLHGADWGELDYLVLDLPPGTGDIVLTICQVVPLDGAVIVTTPQKISMIDVVKGIRMFNRLDVPVIAVVENMAYFTCDKCESRHELFGQGARQQLIDQFGIQNAFELPLIPALAAACDSGTPFVVKAPEDPVSKIYRDIVNAAVREVERVKESKVSYHVEWIENRGVVVRKGEQEEVWDPVELRARC
ncbi:MAG: iron-sulfur cluster carrier protein ApbC, partial [Lentisphaerae bacterium]